MNEHEAQRIASAMHELRPDWPTRSVLTLINKNLLDKPRRDVTVALSWVACEGNSHTPARVLESGPWWKAVGVETSAMPRDTTNRVDRCSICSLPQGACRMRWAHDHDFESMAEAAKRRAKSDPEATATVIAALKDELAHTEPPSTDSEQPTPA